MRKVKICIVNISVMLVFLTAAVYGSSLPAKVSVQGQLKDKGGSPVTGRRDMVFKVYDSASGGQMLLNRSENNVGIDGSGIYNVELDFAGIQDLDRSLFLEISVGGDVLSPRMEMLPSVTALFSKDSDLLDGRDSSYYLNNSSISYSDNLGSHIATTTLNMSGFDIQAVASVTFSDGSVISSTSAFLGINQKAADSDLLDGKDGSYYITSGADNLGNHKATTTLDMANNALTNIDWGNSGAGSGSGLDADLLDGRDGAYYSVKSEVVSATATLRADLTNEMVATDTDFNNIASDTATLRTDIDAKLAKAGGTMNGNIDMAGNLIVNLSTPITAGGAATKSYVDNSVAAGGDNLGNHTATGDIDMSNNAITNIDWSNSDAGSGSGLDADKLDGFDSSYFASAAAVSSSTGTLLTKSSAAATYVNISGETMSGDIDMNTNKIINLSAPAADADAATKKYVDDFTSEVIVAGDTVTWTGSHVWESSVAFNGSSGNVVIKDGKIGVTPAVGGHTGMHLYISDLDLDHSSLIFRRPDNDGWYVNAKFYRGSGLPFNIATKGDGIGNTEKISFYRTSPVMALDRSGKCGIGTDSPAATLDVNGNAQFGSTAKSTFSAAGALTFPDSYTPVSDYDAATKKYVDDNLGGAGDVYLSADQTFAGQNTFEKMVNISSMTKITVTSGGAAEIGHSDNSATGDYAIALGNATTASGWSATAMGWNTTASAFTATAMGDSTTAAADGAVAMGYKTNAIEDVAVAMGWETTASGHSSIAMGNLSIASGDHSFAAGVKSSATAQGAFAISDSQNAQFLVDTQDAFGARFQGGYSFTGGTAAFSNAVGIGGVPDELLHLKQSDSNPHPHMLKLENSAAGGGYYNMGVGATGATTEADSFFIGDDLAYRFVIASNGYVGIGNNTKIPAYKLDVDGDIRALGSVYYGGSAGNADGNAYTKPDYVFEDGYNPLTTEEVEIFLKDNGHLPWLTSADQDKEENNGAINMTRMNFETVETAENLQLQIIELQKTVKAQQEIIEEMKEKIDISSK